MKRRSPENRPAGPAEGAELLEKGVPQSLYAAALAAIWLIVALLYSYIAISVPERSSFIHLDENNTWCVARQIKERGTPFIDSPLNERFGTKMFRQREVVEARENRYTAFNSIGLTILVSLGFFLNVPFFVVPFLASLGVFGIYLLASEIYDARAGILAALLYGLLPTVAFSANLVLDAAPSCALFLLAWGALLRGLRTHSKGFAALGGFSLGLSFFIRQSMAAYIALLLVYIFWLYRKAPARMFISFAVPAALMAATTISVNKAVYGSFLTSGQSAGLGKSSLRLLQPSADLSALLHSISTYILGYVPLLAGLALAGSLPRLGVRLSRRGNGSKSLLWLIAIAAIILFGTRSGTWGFSFFTLESSMARYFMPVHASVAVLTSLFLAKAWRQGRTNLVSVVIVASLFCYAATAFSPPSPFRSTVETTSAITRAKKELLEENDRVVVFTKRLDKHFYNDMEVALCYVEEDAAKNPDLQERIPIVDPEEEVLPIADQLIREGWVVLVASDAAELIDCASARGYKLKRMSFPLKLYRMRLPASDRGESG